jgi:hypothetical protein
LVVNILSFASGAVLLATVFPLPRGRPFYRTRAAFPQP